MWFEGKYQFYKDESGQIWKRLFNKSFGTHGEWKKVKSYNVKQEE